MQPHRSRLGRRRTTARVFIHIVFVDRPRGRVTTVTRPKIGRYAAGDFPQAQQFLRAVFVNPGDFAVSVPGDQTGQWLTGTISRTRLTAFTVSSVEETSDLRQALKVSP